MDLSSLQALRLDASFSVLGVAATVTRPPADDTPILTTLIWLSPIEEAQVFGEDRNRIGARKAIALRRSEVPTAPRGTTVVAAEPSGGAAKTWRVDGTDQRDDAYCLYRLLTPATN